MSAVQIQERRVNTSGGTSAKATTVNGQFSQIIKKHVLSITPLWYLTKQIIMFFICAAFCFTHGISVTNQTEKRTIYQYKRVRKHVCFFD